MNAGKFRHRVFFIVLMLYFSVGSTRAQQPSTKISKYDRDQVLAMLDSISADVKRHYYDPKLHGIDWDTNVKNFREKIVNASSLNRGMSEVAASIDVLNDSHTFFVPPPRPYKHDFGWQIAMVGQKCLVLRVRPQSGAEKQGIRPGDEVLTINGFIPGRDNLWKLDYIFNILRPQPALHVSLLSPSGENKNVDLVAAMRPLPKWTDLTGQGIFDYLRKLEYQEELDRMRYVETDDDLMVLKFPEFAFTPSEVDSMMKKARKHKTLIIDLRGNHGGSVVTLNEFLGNLFDHDVKICDRVTRDNSKPQLAKSRKHNAFGGTLIVLVDSRSASASEVLARVVQIEKRGTVLGDKSAGAVMEARHYHYQIGFETIVPYAASITEADLIMTDGRSLEHVGVLPDEMLVQSPSDLAAGRDTVMARAVVLGGGKMTPEAANQLLPHEWPKD
jgi:C-terminal processing protease CtpA/Prc